MNLDIGIEANKRQEIASGLSRVLADSYTLSLKTHSFHWNVTGPWVGSTRSRRSATETSGRQHPGSVWYGAPAINSAADACDHADARSSRDQLSTHERGHRSSLLASRRPDDQQARPRRRRRSC